MCTSAGGCEGEEICDTNQGDFNNNSLGDVCECYADINNDGAGDSNVNVKDVMVLANEYLREDCFSNPPCYADINQDGKVNIKDVMVLADEYLREDCPAVSP